MELKTAYDVLGLTENATLAELEAHYFKLTEERTGPERLEQVQTAYNIVRNHINIVNPPPPMTWLQKTVDFIYFYRLQLIIGLIGVALVGSLAFTFIKSQQEKNYEKANPADIFIDEDLDPLEARIKDLYPEWDKIKLHLEFSPDGLGSGMEIGAAQKSQVFLATEKPDLYIFDQHHFDIFNDDTLYAELDGLEGKQNLLLNGQDKVIGLDLTDHDIFTGMDIASEKKFAVTLDKALQKENAIKLLLELAK